MTTPLDVKQLSQSIQEQFPDSVLEAEGEHILLKTESLEQVARYCHVTPELSMDFLSAVTGTDYIDYMELVYHLVSIKHNHRVVLKTRVYDREEPVVPSITGIWEGANFQEREIYDLLGVSFSGHPNLKRILLWEGFEGHPHRKDFTTA